MRKSALAFILVCILLSCNDATPLANSNAAIDSTYSPENLKGHSKSNSSAWNYSEEEDKMTSHKINYAYVEANDLLDLKFPYNGGVTAKLYIRRKRNNTNAF